MSKPWALLRLAGAQPRPIDLPAKLRYTWPIEQTKDLDHPYRLILEPANVPAPRKPDGGLDWTEITAVMIIGVEDTHE